MEIVTMTKYKCSICGEIYNTKKEAQSCESKLVSQDKGVKVGDTILITQGDGKGHKAIVERIWIVSKYWGHYARNRYWHTIVLYAKIIDDWRNRMLLFDDYNTLQ